MPAYPFESNCFYYFILKVFFFQFCSFRIHFGYSFLFFLPSPPPPPFFLLGLYPQIIFCRLKKQTRDSLSNTQHARMQRLTKCARVNTHQHSRTRIHARTRTHARTIMQSASPAPPKQNNQKKTINKN